jgi:hypothetical protein
MNKKDEQIISELIQASKKKKEKKAPPKKRNAPEPFFNDCVSVWFHLVGELLPLVDNEKAVPSFTGAEPTCMKSLLTDLRLRALNKSIEWDKETAKKRFEAFIRKAWSDSSISKNFCLRIISLERNKVFNNQIIQKKNGSSFNEGSANRRVNLESPKPTIKSKGGFGKL